MAENHTPTENKLADNLIICPICARKQDRDGRPIKQVLGRVLDNGDFLILRFHHGTTIINVGSDYSVRCGCGYEYRVAHGTAVVMSSGAAT